MIRTPGQKHNFRNNPGNPGTVGKSGFLLPRWLCAARLNILHVRKLQSYCSQRAGEADPRPSNFVSATDFKQKARFGSKFLLFPQLNYLCYFISKLYQKRSQKV